MECNDGNHSVGNHTWITDTTSGFSGLGAFVASPNRGVALNDSLATTSPRLHFQVRFQTTGTHCVWPRGLGETTGDDSVHVGLNGVVPTDVGLAASPRRLPPAEAPTITPPGGDFTDSVEVTLASTTPGAVIRCTDDGFTPTLASPVYSAPFTLTASAQIQALTEAPGHEPSAPASADFTRVRLRPPHNRSATPATRRTPGRASKCRSKLATTGSPAPPPPGRD